VGEVSNLPADAAESAEHLSESQQYTMSFDAAAASHLSTGEKAASGVEAVEAPPPSSPPQAAAAKPHANDDKDEDGVPPAAQQMFYRMFSVFLLFVL
jgi:hypothetical protein